jgi:hypothetical protein
MPDLADLYPGFASHWICVASVLHAMDRSNRSEKTRPHITTSSRGGKSREKFLNIGCQDEEER